jgi:hypothetical protein
MDCEILNSVEVTTIIPISSAISAAVSTILNAVLNHYRDQTKLKNNPGKEKDYGNKSQR